MIEVHVLIYQPVDDQQSIFSKKKYIYTNRNDVSNSIDNLLFGKFVNVIQNVAFVITFGVVFR